VSRDRAESSDDRVVESEAKSPALFRVVGVEPHGWSTILIEDQTGRMFIAATATGRLSQIDAEEAATLIQGRTYRKWHGDRAWTPLDHLPLLAPVFSRPVPSPDASSGESAL
jgi:hypothetical protein